MCTQGSQCEDLKYNYIDDGQHSQYVIVVGSSSCRSINLTHLKLREFQTVFILDSFCLSNIHVALNIQNRYIHQTFIDNKLYNYFKALLGIHTVLSFY